MLWEWDRRGFGRIYLVDRSIEEAASPLLAARRSKRDTREHNNIICIDQMCTTVIYIR